MHIETKLLKKELWPDFVEVFKENDGCEGCWCYNHHIFPGKPDVTGEAAKQAKSDLVSRGQAQGIIAYADGKPAGWCAIDQRADIPGHDCVDTTDPELYAIHCFFIKAPYRGQGLAKQMLAAAVTFFAQHQVKAFEAYVKPPERGEAAFEFLPALSLFKHLNYNTMPSSDENYCRIRVNLDSGQKDTAKI